MGIVITEPSSRSDLFIPTLYEIIKNYFLELESLEPKIVATKYYAPISIDKDRLIGFEIEKLLSLPSESVKNYYFNMENYPDSFRISIFFVKDGIKLHILVDQKELSIERLDNLRKISLPVFSVTTKMIKKSIERLIE